MENNIERITIKEIAPFLPYELKAMHDGKEVLITGLDNHLGWCYRTEDKTGCSYTPVSSMKPLLRNLSCLTKTIQHEGTEFVPLIELAKIAFGYDEWDIEDDYVNYGLLQFKYEDYSFIADNFEAVNVPNQYALFQKLAEWHIDFLGLIEKGLAIDKNTLK